MRNVFNVAKQTPSYSTGILMVRLVVGSAFMLHGFAKIQNPFAWMGPDAATPGFFQALAAVSEFGGGLAWIIGLLTPLASMGIASTMAVAIYTHAVMRGDPFVGNGPSFELASVYLMIAFMLMIAGPGKYSLDAKFFRQR